MTNYAKLIKEETDRCLAIAKDLYGFEGHINYIFTLTGTTGGWAQQKDYLINLNVPLMKQYGEEFIRELVPHEIAHIVAYHVFPNENFIRRGGRNKRNHHGEHWQRVMIAFGRDPKRCHQFDTSKVSPRTEYVISCTCCGREYRLSRIKPPRIDLSQRICDTCKTHTLVWKDTQSKTHLQPQLPASSLSVPIVRPGKSKIDHCYTIYVNNIGVARSAIIDLMMAEVGISKAHASTYYQTCKKRADDNRTSERAANP